MAVIWRSVAIFPFFSFPVGKIESVLFAAVSSPFPELGVSYVKFGSYIAPLWQPLSQITALVWNDFLEQWLFLCHIRITFHTNLFSWKVFWSVSFRFRHLTGQFHNDYLFLTPIEKASRSPEHQCPQRWWATSEWWPANWSVCIGVFLILASALLKHATFLNL